MYQALLALGIPSSAITLDYAGFRTLDSVVRCKLVFGQTACTIISQEYHNYRCIFIAQYYGMKAVAFNALEVSESKERNHFREIFARVRAILDIYIFKTSPKYLGKKVPIQLAS
jgi:SanA protein